MTGWPLQNRYGYGVGKVILRPEPYRGGRGDGTDLRDGLADTLRDWRGHRGWLQHLGGSLAVLGFVLFFLVSAFVALTREVVDDSGVEIVAFQPEPVAPAPEVVPPESFPEPPPPVPAKAPPEPKPEPKPQPQLAVPAPPPKPMFPAQPVEPKPTPRKQLAARPKPKPRPVAKPKPTPPKVQIDALAAAPKPPPPDRARRRMETPERSRPQASRPSIAPLAQPSLPKSPTTPTRPERRQLAARPKPAPAPRPDLAMDGLKAPDRPAPTPRFRRAESPSPRAKTASRPAPSFDLGGPTPLSPAEGDDAPVRTARARVEAPQRQAASRRAPQLAMPGMRAPQSPSRGPQPPAAPLRRPVAAKRSGSATRRRGSDSLAGVPLGQLAACVSDDLEDALKRKLIATVTTQKECVSEAGHYRFLETRNLNAFLMTVERTAGRKAGDRCQELDRALDCLQGRGR